MERKLSSDLESVQGENQRLKDRFAQWQTEMHTRETDLKTVTDRVNSLLESEHQLQMAVDRLNDEKGRLQKQVYDSVSAVERQKRVIDDLTEKNTAVNKKLDELKSYSLDLEGKNRDLYLRARDTRLLPPSPVRLPYTDTPPVMLTAQSPETRPEFVPRLGLTPDRGTGQGRGQMVETTPVRTQGKAYGAYTSPIGGGELDVRGKFNTYKDKKVEFESHLMDLQRRIEEGGKVA